MHWLKSLPSKRLGSLSKTEFWQFTTGQTITDDNKLRVDGRASEARRLADSP